MTAAAVDPVVFSGSPLDRVDHQRRDPRWLEERMADEAKKRSYIEKYLPHIGIALQEILDLTDAEREEAFLRLVGILNRSRKP